MLTPYNPYTFPLVQYGSLPDESLPGPEVEPRAGSGAWDTYAIPVPFDRLLPFVLTRPIANGESGYYNTRWLNCARIEHADTQEVIQDLYPVGLGIVGGEFYLPFRKFTDTANAVEHFVYYGGIIQGLGLACGIPYRLVIDNVYQSPRFEVFYANSEYLLAEWWQDSPANGVPYGYGFRHRFFIKNGALQYADPSEKQGVTLDTDTGIERVDSVFLVQQATFAVPPVPPYLAQGIAGMKASGSLEVDGAAWIPDSIKSTSPDEDGGRVSMSVTVKQLTPLIYKAGCPAPMLEDAGYDPTDDAAHPWRCGDLTDTAPDWQETSYACELTDGQRTGNAIITELDTNPQSPSYNTTRERTLPDIGRCSFLSLEVSGVTLKNDCPPDLSGPFPIPVIGSPVAYTVPAGQFTSTVSQADADAQANAYYNATKQTYANANGTCSL